VCLISPSKFPLHEQLLLVSAAFWVVVIPTWRPKNTWGYIYIYLYLEIITWTKASMISFQSLHSTWFLALNWLY
jgi:hypothetical protein